MIHLAYFAIGEWRYGRTLGKHWLGLRVVADGGRPNLIQSTARVAVIYLFPMLPTVIGGLYYGLTQPLVHTTAIVAAVAGYSRILLTVLQLSTMRRRNGYMGVHEWLTGTRTVIARQSPVNAEHALSSTERFDALADQFAIGPYQALRKVEASSNGTVWLAYDPKLLRRVWIHSQIPSANEDTERFVPGSDGCLST